MNLDELTSETIFKIVQSQFNFDIKKKSRKTHFVEARAIYFKIAKDLVGDQSKLTYKKKETLTDIGRVAGNRDHATVLHSLNKFETYSFGNSGKEFLKNYERIKLLVLRKAAVIAGDEKELKKDIREQVLIHRVIELKKEIKDLKSKNHMLEEKIRLKKLDLNPIEEIVMKIPNNKMQIAKARIQAVVKML